MKSQTAIVCVLLSAAATLIASDKPKFESSPVTERVTIDGKFEDWPGNLEPFADKPIGLQFQNDGDYLYLRLSASDQATRMQILRQGLTVWFDPGGGTKKHFGIRYPVVDHAQYDSGQPGGSGGGGGYGGYGGGHRGGSGGTSGGDQPPDSGSAASEPSPTERVDVLGPGKDDAHEFTRDHLPGIEVALRTEQGVLQYELKVPLAKTSDHPNAIEAVAGKPVGFGFEAPKPAQSSFNQGGRGGGMGGYGGGGGRGGGMGGRGGGMGHGGGGGQHGEAAKPLNGWGTVSLTTVPPAR
jgi:hypothetical protein